MYPIRVVSRRTGISQATLRAWERRYRTVRPVRDDHGRRQYSDDLLQRLLMCSFLMTHGFRVGDIVDLESGELEKLYDGFRGKGSPPSDEHSTADEPDNRTLISGLLRDDVIEATRQFDESYLHQLIHDAVMTFGRLGLVDGFVFPFEDFVGRTVQRGGLQQIHESWLHLHLLRALASFVPSADRVKDRPKLLIGVPGTEAHDLGLIGAAIHADAAGWAPVLVGTAPSEQIAGALLTTGAEAVVLVVVTSTYDVALRDEITRIAELVNVANPIMFGGRMPNRFRDDLIHEGLAYVPHMRALQETLDARSCNKW
ncbi:MAG: MerR family transcriptional regulator [Spirochaetaceae bacterium]|nr:MAG: MerR family transcriptional regulator [Spirochaetaceae bacterium]